MINFTIILAILVLLLPVIVTWWGHKKNKVREYIRSLIIVSGGVLFMSRLWFIFVVIIVHQTWVTFMFGDLCTFISITMLILLQQRKYKWLKIIAPWAIIGGTLTIVSLGSLLEKPENIESFISHSCMYLVSMGILVKEGKWTKNEFVNTNIFIISYISYVLIVPGTLYWATSNKYWVVYSTGLFEPTYHINFIGNNVEASSYAFFNDLGMPYPLPTIIFYGLSVGATFGITQLTNLYHKKIA